jgi:hypothetical protein
MSGRSIANTVDISPVLLRTSFVAIPTVLQVRVNCLEMIGSKLFRAALASLLILGITAPVAKAENTPRKILTGWIPYYSMKTSLPDALNNADIIKEVMPFWYTLKSPTLIRDDYSTANPSWPIADTICLMRKTGLKLML